MPWTNNGESTPQKYHLLEGTTRGPTAWIASSYSGSGGQCVEWAPAGAVVAGAVPVRDSKDPDGAVLVFPAAGWQAFVAAVGTRERAR
ncbi:DUF397 domain-containing protein [Streptomyces johnsoniae]|uniref:DUF397 domain-containing protein n=1 Tax=Streptomyces johnsoniae TaxID=3075532 RepID=A0ABU2S1N8_9ACTN|nr:DUF397 domain-containing protein [Streptomyces sp. DSM 41886]MDT0441704.1 DUF397 domain-containing protein [Streptomyces sp. DSM 41886]